MKLEDHICSLELSKKLKALGIKQESIFVWEYYDDQCYGVKYIPYAVIPDKYNKFEIYSSFTVGELFELLPAFIDTKKDEPFNNFYLHLVKRNSKNIQYILNYYCDTHKFDQEGDPFFAIMLIQHNIYDEKLADCLAKLLICLIENGFIENKQIFIPENAASLILGDKNE